MDDTDNEYFDAIHTQNQFANFNCKYTEDKFENDDSVKEPALNKDEYFLCQKSTNQDFIDSKIENKSRSSPILLENKEFEPNDNDNVPINYIPINDIDDRLIMDDAYIAEIQATLTDEDKRNCRNEARALKEKGNLAYKDGDYKDAESIYTDAIKKCLLSDKEDRAILFSNRAACKIQQKQYEEAIADCSKAIEFNPSFIRALLRRADTYEKADKLDEALADYQKVIELDPSIHQARSACLRLPDQIKVKNEKLKDEMLGKLKDLGNLVLRPFGLSTDNFKVQQDPSTGSYSINFQQNARQ